ncbi:hypothetical protein DFAR_3690051 [Desulfarculales bacterium]
MAARTPGLLPPVNRRSFVLNFFNARSPSPRSHTHERLSKTGPPPGQPARRLPTHR